MRALMVVLLFASSGLGQIAAGHGKVSIESFGFMKGCWVIERPERKVRIEEQWMAPAGGTMIGMSRTTRDGKTTGWEFMRIEASDSGVVFISKPKENKEETVFKLSVPAADVTTSSVVFENPQHDFPQRVIYRSDKPDTLSARIEGTLNGKASKVDFPYKRAKCD